MHAATARGDLDVSKIFPPRENLGPTEQRSYRLPKLVLDKMDEIASQTGYSGTEVALHLLRYAIQEWEREQGAETEAEKKPKR